VIKRRLLAHPRFVLHLTPTSSSWINLVERWFSELTTKSCATHTSVCHLNQDIRPWIETWNKDPKPYVWTKDRRPNPPIHQPLLHNNYRLRTLDAYILRSALSVARRGGSRATQQPRSHLRSVAPPPQRCSYSTQMQRATTPDLLKWKIEGLTGSPTVALGDSVRLGGLAAQRKRLS
jgi:hypothetical protein